MNQHNQSKQAKESAENQAASPPIAIVGMGCLFPQADGPDGFWQLIATGGDAIGEIPPTHWSPEDYFDEDPKRPDFTYCQRGGFLSATSFDPLEFGIPPNVLEATDTSQLLSLVVAKRLLAHAGYGDAGRAFDRDRVGVVLGVTGTQELVIPLGARLGHPIWRKALEESGLPKGQVEDIVERIGDGYVAWQENSFPGLLGNVVAGRIASRLDFGGTNCVVDAACASSLSAMHLGILELSQGRADMMITGGVDTLNDIFMYMCFSKTPALSPTGDARPFSVDADGTVLGEGMGMVLLKRLEDAERDGDTIYAVIRGVGSSSDGRSKSIYAPLAAGQQKALRRAYANSDVTPEEIELVEAHGTGTKVGDATEFSALAALYGEASDEKAWCALGSVKAQIGHTKAAAGSASVIKAALALHHKVLPPTIKISEPNPKLDIRNTPFYLNKKARPWIREEGPRLAGVSSFGFGGSNFHVVLEEYQNNKHTTNWAGKPELFCVSAETPEGLCETLRTWQALSEDDVLAARRFAIEGYASRQAFSGKAPYRLSMIAQDLAGLKPLLEQALRHLAQSPQEPLSHKDLFYEAGTAEVGKVAALFPGQGSQYPGMAGDWLCAFPEAFEVMDEATKLFEGGKLTDKMFPKEQYDKGDTKAQKEALAHTATAQPALGVASLAAWNILRSFGLKPDMAAGHSYGELVALCASGRISPADLHKMSNRRGQLMAAGDKDRGTMVAVVAPLDDLRQWVKESGIDVVLANQNSHQQGVLAGTKEAVDAAQAACQQKGWRTTRLNVSAAFHSALVEDARAPFATFLQDISFDAQAASFPVFANVTAETYPADEAQSRELLARQLVSSVRFVEQVEAMYKAGARVFVEIGPKSVLTGLAQSILKGRPHLALAVDRSKGRAHGLLDLGRALAQLAVAGVPVSLERWGEQPAPLPKQKMSVPLTGANIRTSAKKAKKKKPVQKAVGASAPAAQGYAASLPPTSSAVSQQRAAPVNGQKKSTPEAPRPLGVGVSAAGVQPLTQPGESFIPAMAGRHGWSRSNGQRPMTNGFSGNSSNGEQRPVGLASAASPAQGGAATGAPNTASVALMQGALQIVQEGLRSMQALQHQTATNHQQFLEGQQQAQLALREMLHSSQRLFDASLGLPVSATQPVLSAPQPAAPALPTFAPVPASIPTLPTQPVPQAAASPWSPAVFATASMPAVQAPVAPVMPAAMPPSVPTTVSPAFQAPTVAPAPVAVPAPAPAPMAPAAPTIPAPAAPTPAPAAEASSGDLTEVMLEVVAELTGYPQDMLALDMDMEADLGIDSIKRVEILSGITERLPHLASDQTDHMGSMRTLQEVADALLQDSDNGHKENGAAPAGEGASSTAPFDRKEALAPVRRRLLSVVPLSKETTPLALPKQHIVWITDDGSPLTEAVCEAFAARDVKTQVLPSLQAPEGPMQSLCEERHEGIFTDTKALAGVLLLTPQSDEVVRWRRLEHGMMTRAFALAKRTMATLEASAKEKGAFFATLTRMDGAFGCLEATRVLPVQGGLAGLTKTVAREVPALSCRAIDIESSRTDWDELAEEIVGACLKRGVVEVGLRTDGPVTLALRDAPLPTSPASKPALQRGEVAVITGGARGVTAAVAESLAHAFKPTLYLLGRSPLPDAEPAWLLPLEAEAEIKKELLSQMSKSGKRPSPKELQSSYQRWMKHREILRNIKRIRDAGASVHYVSMDVRDEVAMSQLFTKIEEESGPVRMIIHAAGVIEDKLIVDKQVSTFEQVFSTKVDGLKALLAASQGTPLGSLVLFSSVSGRTGNLGQVDYAMANEVLNKVAQQQASLRPDCHVMSLNWGPWDGGMVTPSLKRAFAKQGVTLIGLKEGAEAVLQELAHGNPEDVEIILGSTFEDSLAAPVAATPSVAPVKAPALSVAPAPQAPAGPLTKQFERVVTLSNHEVLSSHVMGGRPVVPLALMMEWLGHGALHSNPGLQLQGYEGVRVLKGAILEGAGATLQLAAAAGKLKREGRLYRLPLAIQSLTTKGLVHVKGDAILGDTLPRPPEVSLPLSLASEAYTLSQEAMYNEKLFHGFALQGIRAVKGHSAQGMTAVLEAAPAPGAWMERPLRKRWLHDPLVLDAAFQMAILWCIAHKGKPSLPSYVSSMRQFASFPKDGVVAHLLVTSVTSHKMQGDFWFVDIHGHPIAQIEGYECTMDASLQDAFRNNEVS